MYKNHSRGNFEQLVCPLYQFIHSSRRFLGAQRENEKEQDSDCSMERSDRVNLSSIADRKGKRSGLQSVERQRNREDLLAFSRRFAFVSRRRRDTHTRRSWSAAIADRETLSRWPFAIPSRGILVARTERPIERSRTRSFPRFARHTDSDGNEATSCCASWRVKSRSKSKRASILKLLRRDYLASFRSPGRNLQTLGVHACNARRLIYPLEISFIFFFSAIGISSRGLSRSWVCGDPFEVPTLCVSRTKLACTATIWQ